MRVCSSGTDASDASNSTNMTAMATQRTTAGDVGSLAASTPFASSGAVQFSHWLLGDKITVRKAGERAKMIADNASEKDCTLEMVLIGNQASSSCKWSSGRVSDP